MGKYLEIYAEVYDGDVWKATGYRKEKKFPYQRSYQLEPIYNQRDWNYLHELLVQFGVSRSSIKRYEI